MLTIIKNTFCATLQNSLGKISIFSKFAIKLRNQITLIIAAHLNDGIKMHDNGEEWLMEKVAPRAKIFIDVGANSGSWTLAFLGKCTGPTKGILFEPSPIALSLLKTNLAQEKLNDTVDIEHAAVSDTCGTLDFYMEPSAGETSSLLQKHSNVQAVKISVNVTTIDAEMLRRGVKFIDILKIDTEGYDLHVLRGATHFLTDQRIGVIQFEYNRPWVYAGSTLAAALELLEKHKYTVYLLKRDGLYDFDYSIYGDFFHYSNFVAIAPNYLNVSSLSL